MWCINTRRIYHHHLGMRNGGGQIILTWPNNTTQSVMIHASSARPSLPQQQVLPFGTDDCESENKNTVPEGNKRLELG